MRSLLLLASCISLLATSAADAAKAPDLRAKTNSELHTMLRKEIATATAAKDAALKTANEESVKGKAYQRWAENESIYRQKMEKDYKPIQKRNRILKFFLAISAGALAWIIAYVVACDVWKSVRSPGWLATAAGLVAFALILIFA